MRIPFPERIPIWYVCAFAGLLFLIQTLQHTDAVVSICCLSVIITAGAAFNVAGGFSRPSGAYVFFFATLAVILGLMVKAFFGEAADSNLAGPRLTFEIYAVGMFAMLATVYLNRRLARRKGLLEEAVDTSNMRMATIGCVVAGIVIPYVASLFKGAPESVFTPLLTASTQLNRFLPMAIILGVTYEVKHSGGRRSVNIWVLLAAAAIIFDGAILSYSKEALFLPPVCWLAAGAALGYRYRVYQILGGVAVLYFLVHYMVPYCQYGRIYRSETNTFSENFANARGLLVDLPEVVRLYNADLAPYDEHYTAVYFSQPAGLFDRLQMISFDDALNQVTEQKGPLGSPPLRFYILNSVPHFIWKNKPQFATSNLYGHEIGILAEDDYETSISFSPMGEAFRIGGWAGILILAPLVWFGLFFLTDSLCGDVRRAPWGILAVAAFSHTAPEGGMGGCFYQATYGLFTIAFVAFFSAYVMPLIASLVAPPLRPSFIPLPSGPPLDRTSYLAGRTPPPASL